jgi:hypothetical protein
MERNVQQCYTYSICAGRYLAERVGFTFGLSVLAAYDIVPINEASTPNRSEIIWEDSGIK